MSCSYSNMSSRFPSKFARRRHMQKSHSGADAQAPSLSCHICGKRFPSNFAKLQHLKKVNFRSFYVSSHSVHWPV